MRPFLLKISLFFLFAFLADKGFYFLLARFEDKVHDQRLRMVVQGKMERELLIFGSSKGAKGVIARQIQEATQLSTHNLSYQGADLSWQLFLLRTLLKHNAPPKYILLALDDPFEFRDYEHYHFPSYNLYPLAHYDYLNEALIALGEHSQLSRYLMIPRLKSQHFSADLDGVAPLDSVQADGSQITSLYSPKGIWWGYSDYQREKDLDAKTQQFQDFQALCKTNGIQLILLYPPNFRDYNPSFVNRVHELTSPETWHCHYDTTDVKYRESNLFYDMDHLRKPGAEYFTQEIIGFLNATLASQD